MTPSVLPCLRAFSGAALFTCFLLSAGCTSTPTPSAEYTTSRPSAEELIAQADKAHSTERDHLLIQAAALLLNSGNKQSAMETYRRVDQESLSGVSLADYTLNFAALALAEDAFFLARELLSSPSVNQQWRQWPTPQRRQLLRLRGDLYALLGETSASLSAYIELARTSESARTGQDIHDAIWRVLSHTSNRHLTELLDNSANFELKGWYQLAQVSRREQNNRSQHQRAISQWQLDWANHPAALVLPSFITRSAVNIQSAPEKLALLLPLQGPYARAASSVRDGIMASLFNTLQRGDHAPKIQVYDTTSEDILSLYHKAVAQGADAVIGPLRREQLAELSQLPSLPVPVIGLNYLDDIHLRTPNNFYQFGLSISDEAREVARRAWIQGHRRALVLVPDTSWGIKARDTFEQTFRFNGGRVIASRTYGAGIKDFSSVIRPLLLVDQSTARANVLRRTLGKALNHAPKRRQDIDMIFLVAYPDQGRQIKPTLDFYYAHDLPVYATSHIYSGIEDIARNRDLDKIRFTAMPWTMDADSSLQPNKDLPAAFRHLFALGADAYQLLQWVGIMHTLNDATFTGHTGTLTVPTNNRIRREQAWAKFRNGKALPDPGFSGHPGDY